MLRPDSVHSTILPGLSAPLLGPSFDTAHLLLGELPHQLYQNEFLMGSIVCDVIRHGAVREGHLRALGIQTMRRTGTKPCPSNRYISRQFKAIRSRTRFESRARSVRSSMRKLPRALRSSGAAPVASFGYLSTTYHCECRAPGLTAQNTVTGTKLLRTNRYPVHVAVRSIGYRPLRGASQQAVTERRHLSWD